MDVDKEKVSQHGAHLRLGFGLEKLEKDRHAFPHRLLRKRNVQGAADKYLVVAVASEVRSLEDTGLHTRTEKRLIPPRQRLAEKRGNTKLLKLRSAFIAYTNRFRREVRKAAADKSLSLSARTSVMWAATLVWFWSVSESSPLLAT